MVLGVRRVFARHVNGHNGARSAFTLIETLVVVVVIALLASLLFPAVSSIRDRARTTQCLSNQRQLSQASVLYSADHDGKLFYGYLRQPSGSHWRDFEYTYFLDPYLNPAGINDNFRDVYSCPANKLDLDYHRHAFPLTIGVALNFHVSRDETRADPVTAVRRTQLRRPAEQIEFADVSQSSGAGSSIGIIEYTSDREIGGVFTDPAIGESPMAERISSHALNNDEPGYRLRWRHQGGKRVVVCFFDGRSQSLLMNEVKLKHFAIAY